ncbi:DUF4189 domain-containing protein [Shimia sp.]|uniref:DUF4189 domain-containing protein n=1 Tax=Shimia sp. TaxID=1954381 RepID=UPI0032980F51
MNLRTLKLAMMALAMPSMAMAGQCGYEYCWGAVGIGPNGAWGFSWGQYSEQDAVNALQSECEWDCNNVKTFYNTCGAMAEGNQGNWGFGWGNSRGLAEDNAIGYCYQNGGGCQIKVWSCSP